MYTSYHTFSRWNGEKKHEVARFPTLIRKSVQNVARFTMKDNTGANIVYSVIYRESKADLLVAVSLVVERSVKYWL